MQQQNEDDVVAVVLSLVIGGRTERNQEQLPHSTENVMDS